MISFQPLADMQLIADELDTPADSTTATGDVKADA